MLYLDHMIESMKGTDSTVKEENGSTHNDNNNDATSGKHRLSQ